jgi:outer membrane receptor protein involved in Fe transport
MLLRARCIFFALLIAAPAGADEGDIADFEELDLEELLDVVFTAARHEQEIGNSPSAITVVSREDIEASGATSIPDLLRMVPGMDMLIMTPLFSSLSTRVPWTDENSVFLVLVDGREINIELLGFVFYDILAVCLEDIERIEIIRGPASSLYGANALSGVINIQTRAVTEQTSGFIRVSGGEVGTYGVGARASTIIGGWGVSASLVSDSSNIFSDPRITGKQTYRLRSLIERRWSESHRLRLDAGISYMRGKVASMMGPFNGNMTGASAQLSYEVEGIRSQLYWLGGETAFDLRAPLDFGGIRLAEINSMSIAGHMVEGEIQWTPRKFFEPLLIILGGVARFYWVGSDDLLDGETYADITSSDYRKPGVSHWEWRTGAFAHLELKPAEWVTITGGLRLDYNSETEEFLSPRLAAVFRPAPKHFIRLGVARAFRKPSYSEAGFHARVDFPAESPITGPDREHFQEFMSRVIGNPRLDNEVLWSFEGGYLVKLFDDRLSVSLDLYYNLFLNRINMTTDIRTNEQGLPDLDSSIIRFENQDLTLGIWGSELTVRYRLNRSITLMASWAHREVFDHSKDITEDYSPKNLITLGGRFRSQAGLLGSLYLFSRSEFTDIYVSNPSGWFEPFLVEHMENVFLVMGKLGWRWRPAPGLEMEAGVKLFLPVSPFKAPYFRYRERGGVITSSGENFGGDQLRRMVTGYLMSSF